MTVDQAVAYALRATGRPRPQSAAPGWASFGGLTRRQVEVLRAGGASEQHHETELRWS
jgi:hypothetical protein